MSHDGHGHHGGHGHSSTDMGGSSDFGGGSFSLFGPSLDFDRGSSPGPAAIPRQQSTAMVWAVIARHLGAGGFFARTKVQEALVALAEGTNEITFHGGCANWVTGPLAQRADLERALETALALARGIVGVAPPVTAPYR